MPEIITKKKAIQLGLDRYFTGKPCCNGHLSERFIGGRCIECNKVYCSKWQRNNRELVCVKKRAWWRKTNKERTKYHRDYYKRNKEHFRALVKARRKNPIVRAKHRAANAKWRRDNPMYMKLWIENNPARFKAIVHRRRSRLKSAPGSHTAEDLIYIFRKQKGCCVYCHKKLGNKYQVDHIIPLSVGGGNDRNNIQLLCEKGPGACNQRKHNKNHIAFAREMGLVTAPTRSNSDL